MNPTKEVFRLKQKYVPLDKQSKRKRKEYYTAQRRDWGDVNPVTRMTPNPKAYNRKKSGQRYEHEPLPGLFYYCRFIPLYLI